MKRALALTLALLGAALAGGREAGPIQAMPMNHAAMNHSMQDMNAMMLAELRPLRGQAFDTKWTELMTQHHQMALAMAQYELKNGTDARVKANAQQVLSAQQREIEQMQGWLRAWGAPAPMDMSSHMTVTRSGSQSADRWFLTEMIPHHQGAVDMAKLVQGRSQNAELLKLAQNIIKAQSAEIALYQQWLKAVK